MARSIIRRTHKPTKTGFKIEKSYCRTCMSEKPMEKFYETTNSLIDTNGLMSVCSDCIDSLFGKILSTTGSVELTVLRLCKMLNVAYVPSAIESTKQEMEKRLAGGMKLKENAFFGRYKSNAKLVLRSGTTDTTTNMEYQDVQVGSIEFQKIPEKTLDPNAFEGADDLVQFWGTDDLGDIEFLEREFANFKKTHKADTYAEIILMKEVCYKILEMDKARKEGRSVDNMLKALQEVMKNLAISPNIANAASGNAVDSFGAWIKEIEMTRPAEWVENKSIFKDVDNLEAYSEKYITSPLRTFVTGNKEFDLEDGTFDQEGFDDKGDEGGV